MPLIVLTGLPSSGKSKRAEELAKLLSDRPRGKKERTRTITDRGVLEKAGDGRVAKEPTGPGKSSSFKKAPKTVKSEDNTDVKEGVNGNGSSEGLEETAKNLSSLKLDASPAEPPSAIETEGSTDKWTVHIVNDESIGAIRESAYKNAGTEKTFRAQLWSAAGRHLSKDSIVIVDGINGIKGFRYQLYCEAKALPTQYLMVHCACSPEQAKEWNKRRSGDKYTDEQMDDLITRYEEPIAANRWDSPLFTVLPEDDLSLPAPGTDEPWIDRIAEALSGDSLRQNMATMRNTVTVPQYVQTIDKAITDVIQAVVSHQSSYGAQAPPCPIPDCKLRVELPPRIVGLAELRRMKRGWEGLNKMRRVEDIARAVESFVEYLNASLK